MSSLSSRGSATSNKQYLRAAQQKIEVEYCTAVPPDRYVLAVFSKPWHGRALSSRRSALPPLACTLWHIVLHIQGLQAEIPISLALI